MKTTQHASPEKRTLRSLLESFEKKMRLRARLKSMVWTMKQMSKFYRVMKVVLDICTSFFATA